LRILLSDPLLFSLLSAPETPEFRETFNADFDASKAR
jgi:hypothetical protein